MKLRRLHHLRCMTYPQFREKLQPVEQPQIVKERPPTILGKFHLMRGQSLLTSLTRREASTGSGSSAYE